MELKLCCGSFTFCSRIFRIKQSKLQQHQFIVTFVLCYLHSIVHWLSVMFKKSSIKAHRETLLTVWMNYLNILDHSLIFKFSIKFNFNHLAPLCKFLKFILNSKLSFIKCLEYTSHCAKKRSNLGWQTHLFVVSFMIPEHLLLSKQKLHDVIRSSPVISESINVNLQSV